MQDNNCSLRDYVDKGVNFYPYANSGRFAVVWENESANNYIIINEESESRKYLIMDANGKIVLSGTFSDKSRKINIQLLPSGIYFVKIVTPYNTNYYKVSIQ